MENIARTSIDKINKNANKNDKSVLQESQKVQKCKLVLIKHCAFVLSIIVKEWWIWHLKSFHLPFQFHLHWNPNQTKSIFFAKTCQLYSIRTLAKTIVCILISNLWQSKIQKDNVRLCWHGRLQPHYRQFTRKVCTRRVHVQTIVR